MNAVSNMDNKKKPKQIDSSSLYYPELEEGSKAFSRFLILQKTLVEETDLLKGDLETLEKKLRKMQSELSL